jgi:hypothetical protein
MPAAETTPIANGQLLKIAGTVSDAKTMTPAIDMSHFPI